ncbi:MAG: zinc-dependent alcohol dehydrogenase, partial [Mycobacterium sp.]
MPQQTMPAAVNHGKDDLRIEEVAVPELGPGDALVEVSYCGICGSDVHFVTEGWGAPGSTGGHEWSGVVIDVGSQVTKWHLGDQVIGGPGHGCGTCAMCLARRPSLCENRGTPGTTPGTRGAFARYKQADAESLLKVPEGLSLREAALTEPLAVAVHAASMAKAKAGQRILVSGAGPIGLLVTSVLKVWGVDDITVCEPGQMRLERARALGAAAVITPD